MPGTYADFQTMTPAQLATLQVKLTYVGRQEKPVATVAFTAQGNTLDLTRFIPFRSPGVPYGNDDRPVRSFSASTTELKQLIDEAGKVPAVIAGGIAPHFFVSFSLFNQVGGAAKGFEVPLSAADGAPVLQAHRVALAANRAGLLTINDIGCSTGLVEPGTPQDVTSKIAVVLSGLRLNRATKRFVGTASLKNTSSDTIPSPLSLVLVQVSEGDTVQLFNPDGFTCGTVPTGRGFINVALPSNHLGPGESALVKLDFANPQGQAIQLTPKLLAGPGAR